MKKKENTNHAYVEMNSANPGESTKNMLYSVCQPSDRTKNNCENVYERVEAVTNTSSPNPGLPVNNDFVEDLHEKVYINLELIRKEK